MEAASEVYTEMRKTCSKKRIVICSNIYPPHFVGGAELIAHYQAKALSRLGHEVVIFAGDPSISCRRHELIRDFYDGLQVYRVRLVHEDYHYEFINFFHRKVEEHFRRLLDSFSPDVVHFHNIIGLSVGLIGIAKRMGMATVMTLHDNWGFCFRNTLIRDDGNICSGYRGCGECMPFIDDGEDKGIPIRMRQDFLSLQMTDVDAFISPSRYLAGTYIRAGFPREKINVIWNGIDVGRFAGVTKVPGGKEVRFSFIGHFGRHKGVLTFLEALSRLPDPGSVRVNLVGDGEQWQTYERKLRETGLEKIVRFWGRVDNGCIEEVYRNTDVLVLPSVWPENQPVSITEAMAGRTPVIASCMGGIPELVADGRTGYLFEAGNADDLAAKILDFINNPERIAEFGENAYRKIASCSFDNQVKKILDIYGRKPSETEHAAEKLVVCLGRGVSRDCADAMDALLRSEEARACRFVMNDWIGEDLLREADLLWVTDRSVSVEQVSDVLGHPLPLLVPEAAIDLKDLCVSANCGLYYAGAEEAAACIEFLLREKATASAIAGNAYRCLRSHLGDRVNK